MPPRKCNWQCWTQWSRICRQFWHIKSVIFRLALARWQSLGAREYSHDISLRHMYFQHLWSLHDLQALAESTLEGDGICRAGEKERRRCRINTHNRAHNGLGLEHGQDDINY